MNTFGLKIAVLTVVVVGLIVLAAVFSGPKTETAPEPEPKPKTYWQQIEQDDKKLRAEPELQQPSKAQQTPTPTQTTDTQQAVEGTEPKPQFKELSLEDKVQAEKLFEMALAERKMGRLPGVRLGYKKMVEHCREIIERYPNSIYAFKARRMLGDIPKRYWKTYNITDKEVNPEN